MDPLLLVEDDDLLGGRRVPQAQAQHESVELRLRQRERPLVLDRVLGGDHEERVGHLVADPVDGRLALLHAFEKRGLGLRGCPVDFVRQDDLAHDGSGPELELLGLLVVDGQARHVGRQQVRRELDPPEAGTEAPGDRLREDRLAGPRNVLDQEVTAAHERHEGELTSWCLPYHALTLRRPGRGL
jgi:hypothetical protein